MSADHDDSRDTQDARDWVHKPALLLASGTVDFARSRFLPRGGPAVVLSSREAQVLAYLADRANEVVNRDALIVDVFKYSELTTSRALDTCISRLRKKLEHDPDHPETLFTAHGSGYRLFVPSALRAPPSAHTTSPRAHLVLPLKAGELDLGAGHIDHLAGQGRVLLTSQERLLLEVLLTRKGRAIEAIDLARKAALASEGAVRNAVFRLRRKIEVDPAQPDHLLSVPGGCYRFEVVEHRATTSPAQLAALTSLTDYLGAVLSMPDCVAYVCKGDTLSQTVAYGPKRDAAGGVRSPIEQKLGDGIVGSAAARLEPLVCADTHTDSRYRPDLFPARSELAVPVLLRDRLVGVIDLEHPAPDAFNATHVATLLSLAAIAAPAFVAKE